MRFAREIRLRRVKCLRAWVDLFHFTFRECGTFHNASWALFHICRKANISLPCAGAGVPDGPCGTRSESGRIGRPQGSPLQTSRKIGVGATLAVARVGHGRKPQLRRQPFSHASRDSSPERGAFRVPELRGCFGVPLQLLI